MIPLDLSPARWIWLPAGRTLPVTFALFRRELHLNAEPLAARGWIAADSRYRLWVNGERVQNGPAPCDPRALEADPLDLSAYLRRGANVIGIEVLYYGHGDGTSALSWPGLLLRLDIEERGGARQQLVSDAAWRCCLDRSRPPGGAPRFFLRALQERFDAREHPAGWSTNSPDFAPNASRWMSAAELPGPANAPSGSAGVANYLNDAALLPGAGVLLQRDVPMLREEFLPALRLRAAWQIRWHRDPRDYFEFFLPDCFSVGAPLEVARTDAGWLVPPAEDGTAHLLSFEWPEQIVGYPLVEVEAPQGTVIEVLNLEAHDANAPPKLVAPFWAWSQVVCAEGTTRFLAFEYESLRWLQLHIRGNSRPVVVKRVDILRRSAPWPAARIVCSEAPLQRLFDASLNTLVNSAQETVVDGMARERQQYSGDCGHQLPVLRAAFGDTRIPRRFLRTWSQGQTPDGFFLDCWPGYDRLCRVMQRQVGATRWGPLLDHGVGFGFDCWHHYQDTGDRDAVATPFERLLRFADYLETLRKDGLVPVENLGVPSVWIDHDAYEQQRHKECAFNLYLAAMLREALAPLCEMFGEESLAQTLRVRSKQIVEAAQARFWCAERGLFVANLPWERKEGRPRTCDRSLATALLFGFYPSVQRAASIQSLADCPPEMGYSYPANAIWRLQALARFGRMDVVLRELREVWATLPSVQWNNTLQEDWHATPDSNSEWSHCPMAPLSLLLFHIAGFQPLVPGWSETRIAPLLGDLGALSLACHTPHGIIEFRSQPNGGGAGHDLDIHIPDGIRAHLNTWDADGQLHSYEVGPGRHSATTHR